MAGELIVAVVLVLCVSACSSPRRGEPIAGPLRLDSEQAARGRQVFMIYCHKCHPGGEAGLGPALNNKPLPGVLLKAQVRAGLGAMPGFSRDLLSGEQLDDLVVYLKALRKHP